VAKEASRFVAEVFSGEGGDELFAGYEYLKSLPENILPSELIKITNNLHNTALQRVDRCSSASGTIAHVPFLHQDVVNYAFSIPSGYKLHKDIEKWILRKAMQGNLPERILNRPKAKFWEGAGVKEIISSYADKKIRDHDFNIERKLSNGWILNTKEELLYYRIFRDRFGADIDLQWMGRTENSPVAL
jgi:asparagine synthase (glutamine-hydrolysing)